MTLTADVLFDSVLFDLPLFDVYLYAAAVPVGGVIYDPFGRLGVIHPVDSRCWDTVNDTVFGSPVFGQ